MRQDYDITVRQPGDSMVPAIPYAGALGQPAGFNHALPGEAPEPSLLRPILRQWWLVLLCILIGAGAAVAYVRSARPLYTSFVRLYIPPANGAVAAALGSNETSNYLSTQVEVIKSSTILDRVARLPGMKQMKTFAPADGNVVFFLRKELNVDLERKTDVIDISLDSPYPQEAAVIVQAVSDEFTGYCQESRDDQSNRLVASLEARKKDEDLKLEDARMSLREFQLKYPNISLNDQNSVEMLRLQTFSQALNAAQVKLDDASLSYAPNHPALLKLKSEVKSYQEKYDDAMEQVTRANDKTAEMQRLTSLQTRQQDYSAKIGERLHELQLATGGRKLIDVDLVEPARVADEPSSPRKNRAMAIALVCGALLGCGLALLRDRMDGRLRTLEEIQSILGLPILGVVPAMTGRRTAVARAMTVHLDPRSVVAEAYRTIRTAVYFGAASARCKTILVTSPEPGDGKTTSASNLAIAIAQTGRTVLLLDADFRKPTQHKNLDIKDTVGLSSVLAGRETIERALQHTGVEGLDILPCGPIPANPSEILNSREFAELVDDLATRYDHILFDSPPVNPVTDGRILAAVCDATVLVLRADKSTRKAAEHARNSLLSVGARVLGVVVNDTTGGSGYGTYGGSYYGTSDPATRSIVPSPARVGRPDFTGPAGPRPRRRDGSQDPAQPRRDIA